MPARTPLEVHEQFAAAFSAGELETLMSLCEPDAVLVPQPGQIISGHTAIREALGGFLSLNGRLQMESGRVIQAENIALLFSRWNLRGTDRSGNPVALSGQTSDVFRRRTDGIWLLVIDNPYDQA